MIPGDQLPESDIEYIDLLVHLGMYGTWMILYFLEIKKQFSAPPMRYLYIGCCIFVIYGGLMEFLQETLVPGRYGAWSDFIANTTGCMLALLLIYLIKERKTKHL